MSKRVILLRLTLLTSLILLWACQTRQSSQAVVFSAECDAPCWRNIKPGETHFSDAVEAIRSFQDYDPAGASLSGSWYIFSSVADFGLKTGEYISVYSVGDLVTMITFQNPGGIIFAKCAEEFGAPQYATQFSIWGQGSPLLPASSTLHPWLFAINPARGVVYASDTYNAGLGPDYELRADTLVSRIQFFDPKDYRILLEKGFLVETEDGFTQGFSKDRLSPWNGYGDIRQLYPEK